MTRRWFIYALRDPITWDVRYVGKANDPAHRFKRHLTESPQADYRSGRWLLSLRRRGLSPMLELLDSVAITKRGQKQSPETRAKRSAALLGHAVSQQTREKIAATKIGKPRSPETVAKMSAGARGKVPSAETRAKLRVSQQARRRREAEQRAQPQVGRSSNG